MAAYYRTAGTLELAGTVTSDGFVIGSAHCTCGWSRGPGAFLGSVRDVDAITGHVGCSHD